MVKSIFASSKPWRYTCLRQSFMLLCNSSSTILLGLFEEIWTSSSVPDSFIWCGFLQYHHLHVLQVDTSQPIHQQLRQGQFVFDNNVPLSQYTYFKRVVEATPAKNINPYVVSNRCNSNRNSMLFINSLTISIKKLTAKDIFKKQRWE